jgi:hypothetical protein
MFMYYPLVMPVVWMSVIFTILENVVEEKNSYCFNYMIFMK